MNPIDWSRRRHVAVIAVAPLGVTSSAALIMYLPVGTVFNATVVNDVPTFCGPRLVLSSNALLGPRGPVCPGAPAAPSDPAGPAGPWAPGSPLSPWSPLGPA